MYKLDLENAEEPKIKFPTSIGSLKKQQNFGNTCTSVSLTMLKPLTVRQFLFFFPQKTVENSSRDGNTRSP